jgi:hypothetical protein
MILEESYKTKFELLEPWGIEIFQAVKKEIKGEYLPKNPSIMQKYFHKKVVQKLGVEEMAPSFFQEIKEGNEELGEWICNRWMLKNAEIYHFFAEELSKINPQFDAITSFSEEQERSLMERSLVRFGAARTYIFSLFNAVAFSEGLYAALRSQASVQEKVEEAPALEINVEELKRKHAEEISRLVDKYEKRLLGVQKKYVLDTEGLKKQIAQLHRKLG